MRALLIAGAMFFAWCAGVGSMADSASAKNGAVMLAAGAVLFGIAAAVLR